MIPVLGFAGQKVAVFGLGRTGLTAARALNAGGAKVVLWDENPTSREAAVQQGFDLLDLAQADLSDLSALILSPGVPLTHPSPHWTVTRAKAFNVPILGDMELFARALANYDGADRPKLVAITGTNGKSTTTALIGWVLQAAGKTVHVGGNIGIGVLDLPPLSDGAIYVLETSSYQLDLTHEFAPDVAILLNVTPDHLDRHGDMAGYVAAKARIFQAQGAGATALIGAEDVYCRALVKAWDRPAKVLPISSIGGLTAGIEVEEGRLYEWHGAVRLFVGDLGGATALRGRHNWQNAAAAYGAVRALGLSPAEAFSGLLSFPGLAHRMQQVGAHESVVFINDSKATNADAARQAMLAYDGFYWIAGGVPKAGGIAPLSDLFPRIRQAFLIGQAADEFAEALGDHVPHQVTVTLEAAVRAAYQAAKAAGGGVVLLSPA